MREDQAMRSRHWKAPQKGPWLARDTRDPVPCQRFTPQPGTDPQFQESGSSTPLGFPWPPQRRPEPQTNPADQTHQHLRRFAEAKIVSPTPQIRGQFLDRGFDADAFGPACDLPNSLLTAIQSFRRDHALHLGTHCKAESEKLSFLRSCHRALGLIDLEFELACDEPRNTFHHSLTGPFAANVDITIVRITNKAQSTALQLPVEFVEHEITEQGGKRTALRRPFDTRADQSVLQHPGV